MFRGSEGGPASTGSPSAVMERPVVKPLRGATSRFRPILVPPSVRRLSVLSARRPHDDRAFPRMPAGTRCPVHFYASRRELPVGANAHRSRINLMSVFFLQSILVPFQYVRLLGSTRSLVCHARPGLPPTSQRCSSHPSARARTSPVVFPVATIAEMQKIRPNLQPPPPDLPARAVRRL